MNALGTLSASAARWRDSRWLLIAELVLVVGLWIADLNHLIPLTSTPFMLAIAWVSLRMRGLRWSSVGFTRRGDWRSAIGIGLAAGVAMELFATFVTTPWLASLTGRPPDLSDFRGEVGNPQLLLVVLALSWVLAAFGEELAYRGYLLNRVAGLGRDSRGTWVASALAVGVMFGLQHESQGITGMVQEGLSGLLLGLLYLGCGRNLTAPIVAHGVSNTVAFVLIYFGRYPGV